MPAVLLFRSGVAALAYQMLCVKQLVLIVEADVHVVTTAVSAFFAGLAIGGGNHALDRRTKPK
jgi:spermidine synthase